MSYIIKKWAKIRLVKPIIGKEFYIRGVGDHQFGASSKLHYDSEGNTYLHVCFCPTESGTFEATLYFHDRIYRNGAPYMSKKPRYKVVLKGIKEQNECLYFFHVDAVSGKNILCKFNEDTIEHVAIDDVTFRVPNTTPEQIADANALLDESDLLADTAYTIGSQCRFRANHIVSTPNGTFFNASVCYIDSTWMASTALLKIKPISEMNHLEIDIVGTGAPAALSNGMIESYSYYIDIDSKLAESFVDNVLDVMAVRKSIYKIALYRNEEDNSIMALFTGKTKDFNISNVIMSFTDYPYIDDACEYNGIIYGIHYEEYYIEHFKIDIANATLNTTRKYPSDFGFDEDNVEYEIMDAVLYNSHNGAGDMHICFILRRYDFMTDEEKYFICSKSFDSDIVESIDLNVMNMRDYSFAMFQPNPCFILESTNVGDEFNYVRCYKLSFDGTFSIQNTWSIIVNGSNPNFINSLNRETLSAGIIGD